MTIHVHWAEKLSICDVVCVAKHGMHGLISVSKLGAKIRHHINPNLWQTRRKMISNKVIQSNMQRICTSFHGGLMLAFKIGAKITPSSTADF